MTAAAASPPAANYVAASPARQNAAPKPSEPAWEVALLFPPQGQWSEGDFLSLNSSRLVEYSFGNIEVVEMATQLHQDLVGYLYGALLIFVKSKNLGKVNFSPLPVKLFEGKIREPDVLFMTAEHDHRRQNEYWNGADLVMEVVSDNDRRRDLQTKRLEYAQAGIPEYWIIDPQTQEITVLALAGTQYEVAGTYRTGDRATSVLLAGFEVAVADVFAAK
jgi:Uma2 family endonuclease